MENSDYPALIALHAQREYKFDIPLVSHRLTEEAILIESEAGEIIAAGFAIRTPEIVLLMGKGSGVVRWEAIRRIDQSMRNSLRSKGYSKALAVISPTFKGFVRHLRRKFHWVDDYPSYRIEI